MLRLLITVLVTIVFVGSAGAAEAQIYTWRNADGELILSDTPLTPTDATVQARRMTAVRTSHIGPPDPDPGFSGIILREATRQGVRPELVRAVIQVESAFDPRASSSKGAMGLMQLMPGTAADMGVGDPYDPEQNIRGGVAYLRHLLDRFDGNEELALAAYNAGPEAVARHGNHVPPYRETRNYLDRVRLSTTVTNRRLVAARVNSQTIYKTYEIVDGRQIRSYSDVPAVQRRATTVPAPVP